VAITSNLLAIPADYDGAVTLVNIADPANRRRSWNCGTAWGAGTI